MYVFFICCLSSPLFIITHFSMKHLMLEWLMYDLLMLEKSHVDVQALQ